ncbi:MAG: right-handed parallel beta-helix repeat-containing protein [Candidatus Eisenbacteria sp.]|nr:right-handed parallel beta-helix repeat-containing protein [Candidatus Eisenbacteria bacterium]
MHSRSALSLAITLVCLSVSAVCCTAAVYLVQPDGSGDLPTIAAALQYAISGDVIELGDGEYNGPGNRDLDFAGKALTLCSQTGRPENCIIDVEGSTSNPHRVISFRSGETLSAVLSGITLRGGHLGGDGMNGAGAGILCEDSSPTIENCVIENNEAGLGGGIYCWGANPVLRDCVIRNNSTDWLGGGIACEGLCELSIEACRISGNQSVYGAGLACLGSSLNLSETVCHGNIASERGGGLYSSDNVFLLLDQCTFAYNEAPLGSGISLRFNARPELSHCLIAFGAGGEAIEIAYGSAATLFCSDIFGNEGGDWTGDLAAQLGQDGNIALDPLFCGDAASGNLYLQGNSPCSDAVSACGAIGALPVLCAGAG